MMTTAAINAFDDVAGKLSSPSSVADVDGDLLPTDDMSFFMKTGLKNLMFAMLKQSIKDLIANEKDKHAPAEIAASARWLGAKGGRDCIEFLMPGVSVGFVTAKIYANPQEILQAMEKGEVVKTAKGETESVDFVLQDAFAVSGAAAANDAQHAMSRADDSEFDGDEQQPASQERLWG